MRRLLADTGVWYALFDDRDSHHTTILDKADLFDEVTLVIPWPVLYETLGTRFVKNKAALARFERQLKRPNIFYLDDASYRDAAFDLSLSSSLRGSRPLSLVDCAIRLVLDDANTRIDYFATFNHRDFADVCEKRRIEMMI